MFAVAQQGAVQVVSGDVPLDHQHTDELLKVWRESNLARRRQIVIALDGLPLIDSAGLELLLSLRDECRAKGGVLKLAGPNRLVRDILGATRIGRQFEIFEDSLSAIASFV
jgi:anti-anti-sigma factor